MGAQPSNGRCERGHSIALTTERVFEKLCEKCSLSNNGEPTFWKTEDETIYEISRLAPGFSEVFPKMEIPERVRVRELRTTRNDPETWHWRTRMEAGLDNWFDYEKAQVLATYSKETILFMLVDLVGQELTPLSPHEVKTVK